MVLRRIKKKHIIETQLDPEVRQSCYRARLRVKMQTLRVRELYIYSLKLAVSVCSDAKQSKYIGILAEIIQNDWIYISPAEHGVLCYYCVAPRFVKLYKKTTDPNVECNPNGNKYISVLE